MQVDALVIQTAVEIWSAVFIAYGVALLFTVTGVIMIALAKKHINEHPVYRDYRK